METHCLSRLRVLCILAFPDPSGTARLKRSYGKASPSAEVLSQVISNGRTSLKTITQPWLQTQPPGSPAMSYQ
ncbi:hypothetical protein KSC_072550 [Ktedonobacter sp. SOSP1-52]|nr:hypothetical protein KSC_072550 [Ktedonobacter sp. SOSP1-52]